MGGSATALPPIHFTIHFNQSMSQRGKTDSFTTTHQDIPMKTPEQLEEKFWKALKSDRTAMLGLVGVENGHTRPMTAMVEEPRDSIWFFSSSDSLLVQHLTEGHRATMAFAAKDHDLFACVEGSLWLQNDRAAIDRLWNPFVAAWYEGGKDDPKLALLRFEAQHLEIWLNESSLLAGVKLLLGVDPKKDYRDKVAEIDLR